MLSEDQALSKTKAELEESRRLLALMDLTSNLRVQMWQEKARATQAAAEPAAGPASSRGSHK